MYAILDGLPDTQSAQNTVHCQTGTLPTKLTPVVTLVGF